MAKIFNRTLDLDEKAAYLMAVDDLPFEACQQACQLIYRTESFMPVPSLLRSAALEWMKRQQPHAERGPTAQEQLQLREELVSQEAVRTLLASVWPEERERWAKDPIPPYEQEDTP